jgi:uncharacterized protein YpmB
LSLNSLVVSNAHYSLYYSKTNLYSYKIVLQKKKVRVISLVKKTSKDIKKKTASNGISKARKSLKDVKEVKAQREARKKEL